MALSTLVKIGGITNLSDARYCAGMGVDMLGFGVIEGQPDFVAAPEFQEIRGWISGPKIVAALYGLNDSRELARILSAYQPDYLELSVHELDRFSTLPLPFILSVDNHPVPIKGDFKAAFIQASQYTSKYNLPFMLKITSPKDLRIIEREPAIAGIAMMGSSEIRPGLKSYDHIADVLEALEVD
jgi:phosphoribosylanthranilate isomerase